MDRFKNKTATRYIYYFSNTILQLHTGIRKLGFFLKKKTNLRPNSAIARDRSEPPSPKRLKQEEPSSNETNSKNTTQAISSARPEPEDEDLRRFDEEWLKSGGFDVDFSKLRFTFGAGAVDLEDSDLVREPDTNRNLLNRLTEMSISYYKENTGISLEFVNVLKANYHPSAAITLYITFEAIDSSDKTFSCSGSLLAQRY